MREPIERKRTHGERGRQQERGGVTCVYERERGRERERKARRNRNVVRRVIGERCPREREMCRERVVF